MSVDSKKDGDTTADAAHTGTGTAREATEESKGERP
jgi:hypothetical protein